MRHFLKFTDLPCGLGEMVTRAQAFKRGETASPLKNKLAVLLFEKPSLRTKLSFVAAVHRLGGEVIYFGRQEIGVNERESAADIATVVSTMADIVIVRTFAQSMLEEFAQNSTATVINALSDSEHPCQALADILTIAEVTGRPGAELGGIRVAYVGDGANNVVASLAFALAQSGAHFVVAAPKNYQPEATLITQVQASSPHLDFRIEVTEDPVEAVAKADIVYTDVWASMGQKHEAEQRRAVFAPYQVNQRLLSKAAQGVKFMHCLPAEVGREVASGIVRDPRSVCFQQAQNRMWVQMSLLDILQAVT